MNFFHEAHVEMRPLSHRVHIRQIEYPHGTQRQCVFVEQPVPHQFTAFHLIVGAKRLCIRRRHAIADHPVQVWCELGQRKHVSVNMLKNGTY